MRHTMSAHPTPKIQPIVACTNGNASAFPKWSAIVLAGQRPGVDPLASAFGLESKARVPVLDKPMVSWVIETLLATPQIGNIIVVAQDRSMVNSPGLAGLIDGDRVTFAESSGGISTSIANIIGKPPVDWPVLVTTADHPLLTVEMVTEFMAGTGNCDVAVAAVERRTVMQRYPQSKRTWLKFRGGAYSGANLFALKSPASIKALELWSQAEQDRKEALKLFWHFGPILALKAITRSITFPVAIHRAGRKLGLDASLVLLSNAEAAIDVDKLSDHVQVEEILSARPKQGLPNRAKAGLPRNGVSFFDLDRTLTRNPTYTAMLAYMSWHLARWRLLLFPFVLFAMLGYLCGLYSRRRVKEIEHWLLLGNHVPRVDVDTLAHRFADKLHGNGILAAGKAAIAREKALGRHVVLATAANHFYAAALAERLGITEVVATQSVWKDEQLTPTIYGENCYGLAKRQMATQYLTASGLSRDDVHVRFYSDHISDLPTFEWADEKIAVNPSRKLFEHALTQNWAIVFWL